jgi:hypothetical protein
MIVNRRPFWHPRTSLVVFQVHHFPFPADTHIEW